MAVYINFGEGEADATVQGAEWLQKFVHDRQDPEAEKAFVEKFKALYTNAEERSFKLGPVFDLFVDASQDLIAQIPGSGAEEKTREVESFYALLFSMLLLLEETEHIDQATTRLCETLRSDKETQPELRLRLLMSLYNSFPPSVEFRFRVFKAVLDFASQAGLFDQVAPYLEYLEAWLADWSPFLSAEDKGELYRDLSRYLRDFGKPADGFVYLKTYHTLLNASSSERVAEKQVQESAAQLLVEAVRLPSVVLFDDLLDLASVKALAQSADAGLVKLCEIFLSGTIADFQAFYSANGALFEKHCLDHQEALSKIKRLALSTLVQGRSEVSLAEVAQHLDESVEEVEAWIVRAISDGLIDGRIDQVRHMVLVQSAFQRSFGQDEWAFLDDRISQWTENLESVIKHIADQKARKEGDLDVSALAAAAATAAA